MLKTYFGKLLALAILLSTTSIFAQAPTYTISTIYTGEERKQIGEVDIDKDGNLIFVNRTDATIHRLAADGTAPVIAGGGTAHNLLVAFILQSDTFPALDAALGIATNVNADRNSGNIYLQIGKNTWKLTPEGQLTRFAGQIAITAPRGFTGIGGPALEATIPQPGGDGGAAIGPDGSVFLRTGTAEPQVVKIDPTGVMTLYAGTGERGNTGDGGPATAAQIYGLGAIATDTAGNLYLAEGDHGIRKITPDGIITTIVGSSDTNSRRLSKNEVVDGIDPLSVRFSSDILFLTVTPDGSVIFAESARDVVYQLTPDGKVTTIAGTTDGHSGDGGPARDAQFNSVWGLTSDSAGHVYITEGVSPRYIRKLTRDTPLQAGGGSTGGGDTGSGNTGGGDTGSGNTGGGDTGTGDGTTGGTDTGSTTTLPTGTRGPVALDLDKTTGDQQVLQTTTAPKAGDTVTVDVVLIDGGTGLNGFNVRLLFDVTQLEYTSSATSDVFAGGINIENKDSLATGIIGLNVAFFGTTTTTKASGTMAQVNFKVLDGFTGETNVSIQSAQLATGGVPAAVEVGSGGSFVVLGGTASFPTEPVARTDFSGDGEVGFSDFITFASAFGKGSSDSDFDARIDLNDNGSVDFADFIIFAQLFGQKVSEKPATKSIGQNNGINTNAALTLVPQPGKVADEVTLSVHLTDIETVSAFQMALHYDASALQLMRAETAHPSRIAQGAGLQPVVLQTLSEKGALILSDVFANALQENGAVLNLTFQITHPEAISGIDISNVLIADAKGNINTLQGARLADLNLVPSEFALNQNHPNPFNPETHIGYQLPQASDVSLTIYNLLGQQVRHLVNEPQAAGIYRVSWNGQDALGRSVASGIYFYHLKADQFSQTKMMILLK